MSTEVAQVCDCPKALPQNFCRRKMFHFANTKTRQPPWDPVVTRRMIVLFVIVFWLVDAPFTRLPKSAERPPSD